MSRTLEAVGVAWPCKAGTAAAARQRSKTYFFNMNILREAWSDHLRDEARHQAAMGSGVRLVRCRLGAPEPWDRRVWRSKRGVLKPPANQGSRGTGRVLKSQPTSRLMRDAVDTPGAGCRALRRSRFR